jgi:predicted phage tail protein
MKTLQIILVALTVSLPFAFWGLAYEFSYFKIVGLSVFDTFSYAHYILSGGVWVLIFFGVIMFVSTVKKFFSKNIEKDDWKDVKDSLIKTQFADVIGQARFGFIISIIYLLTVIYFPNNWFSKALGSQNLLMTMFIVQLFFAAMWLSPQQSKFAVIIFFIISIGACFAGGGVGHARAALELQNTVVRDDYLVTITKAKEGKFTAISKPLNLPMFISLKKLFASN